MKHIIIITYKINYLSIFRTELSPQTTNSIEPSSTAETESKRKI